MRIAVNFMKGAWTEVKSLGLKGRWVYLILALSGLFIINWPDFQLTTGLFTSADYSILLPSVYGVLINAIIYFGLVHQAVLHLRISPGKMMWHVISMLLFFSLLEIVLDVAYFRLFYGYLSQTVVTDALLGNFLMNVFFFAIPALITGTIKTWKAVPPVEPERIMIKDGVKEVYVDPDDLLYLESDGNYVTYHTRQGMLVDRISLAKALEELPQQFVRCHKSFIVNVHLIRKRTYSTLVINGQELPIGRKYAKVFRINVK